MQSDLEYTTPLPRRYVTRARRQPPNPVKIAAIALVVTLVGLFVLPTVAFAYVYGGRVSPGIRVMNRDLGGMTHAEARAVLQAVQAGELSRPVKIQGRDQAWTVPLADLGVTVDVDQTIENARLIGRDRDPVSNLVAQTVAATFGWNVKPVYAIDDKQRAAVVNYLTAVSDQPLIDARLTLDANNQLVVNRSQIGRKLDVANFNQQTEQVAAGQRDPNVTLKIDETKPFVNESDLEAMRASAERILSSPVRLTYGKENWTLGRKELAEMLTLPAGRRGSQEQLTINTQLLSDYVKQLSTQINRPPRDAKFGFAKGEVTIKQESQDGLDVDVAATVNAVAAAVGSDQRDVALAVKVDKPKIDSAMRDSIVINERLKTGTSNYGGGIPERLHNVELATERLDGILIAPDEVFSFNQALGPATIANGFKWGFGIAADGDGGFSTVPSEAGGICQVATTLFQAVFRLGIQIEERNPHLYWIPRYAWSESGMIGLDATVDDPSTDFKFRNNTGNWLAISSRVDKSRSIIAFDIWGVDPGWKVKIDGPVITDVEKADTKTIFQESDSLPYGEMWVEAAEDGFTATITRTVSDGGKTLLGPAAFRSVYKPSHNVLMVRKGTAGSRQAAQAASGTTPSTTTSAASGGARITPAQATASAAGVSLPAIVASPAAGSGTTGGTGTRTSTGSTAGASGTTGTGTGTTGSGTSAGAVATPAAPAPSNRTAQPPPVNAAPAVPTKAPAAPVPPVPNAGSGGAGTGGGTVLPPPIATPRATGGSALPPLNPEAKPAPPTNSAPRPPIQFTPAGR